MTESRTTRAAKPTAGSRLAIGGAIASLAIISVALLTYSSLRDFPDSLQLATSRIAKPEVLARDGSRLSVSFQNEWNTTDRLPLEQIPDFLKTAFVISEDQRFYRHHGPDWLARSAALTQNIKALANIRGASTISEQVVRLLHPRPRTLWSRWLEGFEANRLEQRFEKNEILEFYLNQVPYSERRRGVVQAARYYYNRDIATLTQREMLSLVVLVRSPSGMNLLRNPRRANAAIDQLATRLREQQIVSANELKTINEEKLSFSQFDLAIDANHFVRYVLEHTRAAPNKPESIQTTLDPWLQQKTQQILSAALANLSNRNVHDGAALVIDHSNNEILAWVVTGAKTDDETKSSNLGYNSVLIPRQPGSTMKPLLYALAIEKGWTAATLIDDSELSESIGSGVHTFHNYSRTHYGPIRVREALANSLNIPAIKTLQFVGSENFLERLHRLGIVSLDQHPEYYGDGLALGNGEVSLLEMAQAYTVLARQGRYLPLSVEKDLWKTQSEKTELSAEIATLIGDILSDPEARALEFGRSLQFPVQTAIKTGTSSDYRDSWAIAFDYAHTVAVWMGNLNNAPMDGITGSVGPSMVVRSIFSELNRNQDTRALPLSKNLVSARICRDDGRPADDKCSTKLEWFLAGMQPRAPIDTRTQQSEYRMLQPTAGLQIAMDPRIPNELEALPMSVVATKGLRQVDWFVDGQRVASTSTNKFSWPLRKGTHEVYSHIWDNPGTAPHKTEMVRFYVR